MAKPTIVTRAGKGSALTWTEGDANLTNLRDATVSIKAGTDGTSVVSDLNGEITLVAGTNITLSGDNTAKTVTINASGGTSGISNLVEDTTPQLGGDLDVNGKKIVSTSNANIELDPDGTGKVLVASDLQLGTGGAVISYDSGSNKFTIDKAIQTSNLKITTNEIQAMNADGNIALTPDGTGRVKLGNLWFPNTDGSTNHVLKTDGSGTLSFGAVPAPSLDGLSDVSLSAPTNGQVLSYNSTSGEWTNTTASGGASTLNDLTDVNTAGVSNQQLLSYNSSTSSWEPRTVTAGISAVISDTTPSLGGNLNVNGNQIVSSSNGNIVIAPNGTGIIRADKSIQVQAQGELRLADSDSSNYVGFKSPATVSTNKVWTLPAVDGSNGQVLSTNGSATLAWVTAGGGATMGVFFASVISGSAGSYTQITNNAGITLATGDYSNSDFVLPVGSWRAIWHFGTGIRSSAGNTNFNIQDATAFSDLSQNSIDFGVTSYRNFFTHNSDFVVSSGTKKLRMTVSNSNNYMNQVFVYIYKVA